MEFSDRLKSLRLQADMTQTELAEKLSVTRQAVSNYENSCVVTFLPFTTTTLSCDILKKACPELRKSPMINASRATPITMTRSPALFLIFCKVAIYVFCF